MPTGDQQGPCVRSRAAVGLQRRPQCRVIGQEWLQMDLSATLNGNAQRLQIAHGKIAAATE